MRFRLLLPALLLTTLACQRETRPLLNGRVEAYLSDLGPRVGGRLVEIRVSEGQRVKAGDLLARVSAEELDAAVKRDKAGFASAEARRLELVHGSRVEDVLQGEARVKDAEAALRWTEDSLRRSEKLVKDGVQSQADLDRVRSDRDRAAANLNLQQKALAEIKAGARLEQRAGAQAEAQRAQATFQQSQVQAGFMDIRAPFDGLVVHRLRELGAVLAPGQPVLTLGRLDQLWVRVYIPQPLQSRASQGMAVMLLAPGRAPIAGTLDEVSSEAEYTPKMVETQEERVNLVYPARVHVAQGWDKGLLPGLAVTVRLEAPAGSTR